MHVKPLVHLAVDDGTKSDLCCLHLLSTMHFMNVVALLKERERERARSAITDAVK